MKKVLLLSGVLYLAALPAHAQHLSLGPVAGMGHSWTTGTSGNTDFKFSPSLGIGLVYSRNENWGYGTALTISHEGFKAEYPLSNGTTQDVTINPVYLRMPMELIYFFGKFGDKIRPKIYAGPSLGLRIDEHQKNVITNNQMLEATTVSNGDYFSRADLGLHAGVGANIRICKKAWLNMDAGYYHGLVDVMPGDRDQNYNRNIRLNVGVMYGLN